MDPVLSPNTPYHILSEASIDHIASFTGLKPYELEAKLQGNKIMGDITVYWQVLDRWWSMKIAGEYVFRNEVDDVVREAMRRSY